MAITWDLTNVPDVSPDDLFLPMQSLIEQGRGLVLLRGLDVADANTVEEAIWREFADDTARGLAVMLRFRELVKVFEAPRLRDILMNRGYQAIRPAVELAATSRLNATRGFGADQFAWALKAALTHTWAKAGAKTETKVGTQSAVRTKPRDLQTAVQSGSFQRS